MAYTWKILIVCASKNDIDLNNYSDDPLFSSKHYAFFNVGKEPFSIDGFDVINCCEVPGYVRLGRKYAESEVIYNVRKLNLFSDCDYLGLMHSDFKFFDKMSMTSYVTMLISESVKQGTDFMSFFTGMLLHVVGPYNVLFDERKPNCLFVRNSGLENPKSVNEKIVADIERILHKHVDLNVFDIQSKVALCCSFLVRRNVFNEIGDLIVDLIDSHCLDGFDVEDRHRFPGQVAERYVALFSLLYKKTCFQLEHLFVGGHKDLQNNSNAENY